MDLFASISIEMIALIAAVGVVAGILAGLLGVGGGIILVPGLLMVFQMNGYAGENIMHSCVGTSLFIIIFTGLSSARSHWKKDAVDRPYFKRLGLGIVTGVILGSITASLLSGIVLKTIFASVLIVLIIIMFINPARFPWPKAMFGKIGNFIAGTVTGAISTLVGIGGGTLNVPYMSAAGLTMHRAVGTASALGVIIAIPASIGFMSIGLGQENLPPFSLGYVNFLAASMILPISVACAPLGAKLAHIMNVGVLRKFFAFFMVLVAMKLWYSILGLSGY